jgi:hypothetical protein
MTQIRENESPITIDTLAIMINNGFKEVDQRIGSLEQNMNQKFTGIQNQLDNIYLNYPA